MATRLKKQETWRHSKDNVVAVTTYNLATKAVTVKDENGLDFSQSNFDADIQEDFKDVQTDIFAKAAQLFENSNAQGVETVIRVKISSIYQHTEGTMTAIGKYDFDNLTMTIKDANGLDFQVEQFSVAKMNTYLSLIEACRFTGQNIEFD